MDYAIRAMGIRYIPDNVINGPYHNYQMNANICLFADLEPTKPPLHLPLMYALPSASILSSRVVGVIVHLIFIHRRQILHGYLNEW